MKNTIITIIIVIIVFGIGAVYVLRQPSSTGNTTGQTQTPVTTPDDQTPPTTPAPVTQNKPSSMDTQNTKAETAVFHTSMGNFSITLSPETAPKTVANFVKLAQSGFYNGVKFHRVIKDFMIQGGDPNSKDDSKKSIWGQGGPGYKFADELTGKETYSQGTFAMANAGPNTNGSQFFIMTGVNVPLPPSYTVFGHVSSGMDVPLAIEKVPTAPGDQPITDVVINSITIQ